jgi:hypothetical protein
MSNSKNEAPNVNQVGKERNHRPETIISHNQISSARLDQQALSPHLSFYLDFFGVTEKDSANGAHDP